MQITDLQIKCWQCRAREASLRGDAPMRAGGPAGEAAMTAVERRRERAMALGVGTDVLTATPMLGIAIWSHSLTLLADALRGGLLTLLELFAYIMLRRIHRRRLPS